MKKAKKFPQEVARFFNPQKSGSNSSDFFGGTHQKEKRSERSNIPVYNGGGTAIKVVDYLGRVTYK